MIEHLFGSKTRVKMLRLFLRDFEKSLYVREITRLIDSQINAVRRELLNLIRAGVLEEAENVKDGKLKYYRLRKACPFLEEIKSILFKSQLVGDDSFVEEIKTKVGNVMYFVLCGFFVNDDKAPTDILIAGAVDPDRIKRIVNRFEKEVGRNIRYTVFNSREFKERKQLMDKFLYQIFESPHIEVVGYRL